jgi:CRP/FNR family cyclic AMP-dependent transcriptional regulator
MANQNEVFNAIRLSPWFQDVPEEGLLKLAKASKVEKYAKNSFLFCAGDLTKSIYCLLEGRIRVSIVSSIGQEFAINDVEVHGWMGEAGLFSEKGRVLELQFKEAGRALNIPRNMLFYPLKARLAGRILALLEDYGKPCEDGTCLDIALSQKDFARLVLGSRQRINKIFREWDDQGMIMMKDGRYIVPDVERLLKEVELQDE